MKPSPLFSIVIPCYNARRTLKETVNSVLAQTLENWEMIIVDDGSNDGSLDTITELSRQDKRIKLAKISHQGVSIARNTGIRLSTGRYIAFLDADDLWRQDKLHLHAEHLLRYQQVGVSFARVRFMSPSGRPLAQLSAVPTHGLDAFSLLTENHVSTSSNIVARRELFESLGGFQEDMSFAEDHEWLFRVAVDGRWTVAGIAETLVLYRTSQGSLSSDLARMESGWLTMLNKAAGYAPEFLQKHRNSAEAIYFRYLARRALRQGAEASIGLAYINRAWRCNATALLKQPHRSIPTVIGLWAWRLMPSLTDRLFLHLTHS